MLTVFRLQCHQLPPMPVRIQRKGEILNFFKCFQQFIFNDDVQVLRQMMYAQSLFQQLFFGCGRTIITIQQVKQYHIIQTYIFTG